MRNDIHPTYYTEARVTCSCGNSWTTGSTKEEIKTDVCSQCHPFFTGEQRIVDTAGQVDRFMKRLSRYGEHQTDAEKRQDRASKKAEQRFLNQQLAALDLNDRVAQLLLNANIVTVGDLSRRVKNDAAGLMAIEGFGDKSLEEVKTKLTEAREGYFATV